jgi:hypothetical protein
VNSPQEAADLVLDRILSGDYDDKVIYALPVMLSGGESLMSWHEEIAVPFDAWLVLIDDMALANWEHPCRWVFVASDGSMEIVRLNTPPVALPRMSVEHSSLPEHSFLDRRQQLIDWFVPNPQGNDADNCKALLVSGGANAGNNHVRYYGDIQFIYLTLTQDYGYTNDDIIICFADGLDPAPDQSGGANSDPDLDGDGIDDFDYDATLGSVCNAMAEMATLAGPDDHVLYYTTDHGGSSGGWEVYLNLWNSQTLDDDTFDTFIDTFGCASLHATMEQCYSGGFEDEMIPTTGGQPRSFNSAANHTELSWAGATYPDYDEYVYWWTGAMHGSVPPGGSYPGGPLPYDPDINGDSYVDYAEAYDAALTWDSYAQSGQEHPQYGDDPDSCGSSYYLGGLIPTSIGDSNGLVAPGFGLSLSANPVTSAASVIFTLETGSHIELTVFDLSGRAVTTLASGDFAAGQHTVAWDVESAPAGVYVVRLTAEDRFETVRAVRF